MSATPIHPLAPARTEAPPPAFMSEHAPAWSFGDKVGVSLAWAAGLFLCAIAASITLYMLYRGIQYVNLSLLVEHPSATLDQSKGGGFLDPIIGTVILAVIGIAVAGPLGVGIAVWLSEYGRPAGLARAVESGIEIVAGIPSIVLAIFGLLIFSQQAFGFLSFTAGGDAVYGRSFLIAGMMMALIALPLIVGSTREALQAIPAHVREASYALGKDRASTIRRVLLPASRSGVATGISLGMGRIIGDTAIVVILLGGLLLDPASNIPVIGTLTGTGGTLTSYVYGNSPTGEGNAPDKAYAAAFVLLIVVIVLNYLIDRISNRRKAEWTQ
jgi:phosphate transport system permease protein